MPAARSIDGGTTTMKTDRLRDAADDAAEKASDLSGQAGSAMSDAARSARDMAGQVGAKAYDAGTQAGQYVQATVKEQPLLSMIGVAAIGYAIGFLIHSAASPFAPRPPRRRYFGG
jgi:ElaB/YqjD/DUF883 family membrane-anchored ribosome-binding protein